MRWWEDSKVISKNKLSYRAMLRDKKVDVKNLNGKWDFKFYNDVSQTLVEPQESIFEQENWDEMIVPGCWELNGYGKPNYVNHMLQIPNDAPRVTQANPTGVYQREVNLSKTDLENKRIVLRLHGLDSIAKVFVNNKEVGLDKNARVTAEFDITEYAIEGENKIQLIIAKYSDLTYIEDVDVWRFGGIFRDVELLIESEKSIRDVYVTSDVDLKAKKAQLKFELNGKDTKGKIEVSKDGTIVAQTDFVTKKNSKASVTIDKPILWSTEAPELYDIRITTDSNDILIKFGIKDLQIKKRVMYVNGVPIKIRGVNMHDFNPTTGKVYSKEDIITNLTLMKEHNINGIRTAVTPKAYEFYELCDQMGFWVMDEADLESHGEMLAGNWGVFAKDPLYIKHHVEKVKQMVLRDRNYVSIISFSLGNEAGFGKAFYDMADYIRSVVSSSDMFLHYEGDQAAEIMDVHSNMYTDIEDTQNEVAIALGIPGAKMNPRFKSLENVKKGLLWGKREEGIATKPHVECEYVHSMGNGPGSLHDYWDFFYANDSFMGGFIWEWFDHGLKVEGREDYLYGGDFGHIKNDSSFCIDGLLFPNRKPSPGLIETKAVYTPVFLDFDVKKKELLISNRYNFVQPKDQVKIKVVYKKEDGSIISSESIEIPTIKRLETVSVKLENIPSGSAWAEAFATAKNGNVLHHVSGKIQAYKPEHEAVKMDNVSISKVEAVISNDTDVLTISGFNGEVRYEQNGKTILSGNLLNYWRPYIDNEGRQKAEQWNKLMFLHLPVSRLDSIKDVSTETQTRIRATVRTSSPNQPWGFETKFTYLFIKDGFEVKVDTKDTFNIKLLDDLERTYTGEFIKKVKGEVIPFYFPRMGFDFKVDKSFKNVKYLGLGPNENYPDSKNAARYGLYETDVDGLWTNYVVPQENGNRQEVNLLELSNNDQKIIIESKKGLAFNYAKYAQRAIEVAMHPSELIEGKDNYLCINWKNGPLGSQSCGPMALMRYLVKNEAFKMKYTIKVK